MAGLWKEILGTYFKTFRIGRSNAVIDAESLTAERTFTLPDGSGTPALLEGLAGGQIMVGGTASGENLVLQSTANASRGYVTLADAARGSSLLLGTPLDPIFSVSPIMLVAGSTPQIGDDGVAKIGAISYGGSTRVVVRGDAGAGIVIGDGEVEAGRFVSNVTTGTAPLTVSSTTAVSNLNADRVDGKHYSEILADAAAATPYPPAFRHALTWQAAADTANDVIVYPGKCRSSADTRNIVLASALTKRADAAWAAGDNQGGMLTGSRASNTDYWMHLIERSDTSVKDWGFDPSPTSPTLPANYDFSRLIGWVRSNGSNQNLIADTRIQGGNIYVEFRDPTQIGLDVDTVALGVPLSTSTTVYTMPSLPKTGATLYQTIFFDCNVTIGHASSQAAVVFRNADVFDNTPSLSASPLVSIRMPTTGANGTTSQRMRLSVNRNGQLAARSTHTNTTLLIQVLGFEWPVNLGG